MFQVKLIEFDGSVYSHEILFVDGFEHLTNGRGIAKVNLPAGQYIFSVPKRVSVFSNVQEGQTLEIILP